MVSNIPNSFGIEGAVENSKACTVSHLMGSELQSSLNPKIPRTYITARKHCPLSTDHALPGPVHRCPHSAALDCCSRHATEMDRHRLQGKEQCHPPRSRNLRSTSWHRPELHHNQYQPPGMSLYGIADGASFSSAYGVGGTVSVCYVSRV